MKKVLRPRFRPGTRIRYHDGVIYQVAADGSFRREADGKMGKAARKATKKQKMRSHQDAKVKNKNAILAIEADKAESHATTD
jgi:hypothetical protein